MNLTGPIYIWSIFIAACISIVACTYFDSKKETRTNLRSRQFDVPHAPPFGWIQWKGTDACIDIECTCGAHLHHDGDFMYHVQCGRCKQIYECDGFIKLHPIPTEEFEQGRDSVCPVVVLDEGD